MSKARFVPSYNKIECPFLFFKLILKFWHKHIFCSGVFDSNVVFFFIAGVGKVYPGIILPGITETQSRE